MPRLAAVTVSVHITLLTAAWRAPLAGRFFVPKANSDARPDWREMQASGGIGEPSPRRAFTALRTLLATAEVPAATLGHWWI